MNRTIEILGNLEDFFRAEVECVAKAQNLQVGTPVATYISQLLARFSQSSSFVEQQLPSGEKSKDPVLALLWLEGLQKKPFEQLTQMQYLGDVALFTSGFFSERIERSVIDRDYYMAMGGQAYQQAGTLQMVLRSEQNLRDLFFTLSETFPHMVSLLEEISMRAQVSQAGGVVKVYQKWLKSPDHKTQRVLQANGVIPQPAKGGDKN